MTRIGVAKLKASLSMYLAKVKEGEEVVVTDRGRAIARLVPVAPLSGDRDRVERLARLGTIRLPPQQPTKEWVSMFLDLPRGRDPEGSLLSALIQEREEGW